MSIAASRAWLELSQEFHVLAVADYISLPTE